MYPQIVIAQYSQFLAAMYVASLLNPANYYLGSPLMHVSPAGVPRSRSASHIGEKQPA